MGMRARVRVRESGIETGKRWIERKRERRETRRTSRIRAKK